MTSSLPPTTADASGAPALRSIAYSSQSVTRFDDDDLAALLSQSRMNNERLGLTGVLLYRDGRFVQLLEGPGDVLDERMGTIAADPRHRDLRVLLSEQVTERLFPSWTMSYPSITPAAADAIPGYRRTFDDLDADIDFSGTPTAFQELLRWFRLHEQ